MSHQSFDSEGLVVQTCERHNHIVAFVHFPQHSEEDKKGKDFLLIFPHNGIRFNLQVSTSDNNETLAIYLPISDPPPAKIASRLTPQMQSKVYHHQHLHFRKSSDPVPYILFVRKLRGEDDLEPIQEEIWEGINEIYNRAFSKTFSAAFNAQYSCRYRARTHTAVSQ